MTQFEPDDDEENESEETGPRALRNRLKQEQANTAKLQAELEAASGATRELAFLKAGIEDSKTANFFRAHYDGELTAEAIKSAAQEAGIIPETTAESDQSVQGQSQMAQAMAGGETAPYGSVQVGPSYNRIDVPAEQGPMWQEFEKALQSGPMGAQRAAEVLRQHGHELGTGDTEPLNTAPNVVPLSNQANRII